MERDPFPDAEPWRAIEDRRERLRTGLLAIYGWYERNAALNACVLRDAEHHALTREISRKMGGAIDGPISRGARSGDGHRTRALLQLALSFFTWRTLVREGGLDTSGAVEAMVRAIHRATEQGIVRRPAR